MYSFPVCLQVLLSWLCVWTYNQPDFLHPSCSVQLRLKMECPSLYACRWSRARVSGNGNKGLVIRLDIGRFAVDVKVKMFACPDDCESFALCLTVALLCVG